MLGANVVTSVYIHMLLCNMTVALAAPRFLTFTGTGVCFFRPDSLSASLRSSSCRSSSRSLPALARDFVRIAPVVRAATVRFRFTVVGSAHRHHRADHSVIIIDLHDGFAVGRVVARSRRPWSSVSSSSTVGRTLGKRFGDPAAGGQSLGQKNTVLCSPSGWPRSFLRRAPISSMARPHRLHRSGRTS